VFIPVTKILVNSGDGGSFVSFAAASASQASSGAANKPDPCALLTKGEIQEIIGQLVGDYGVFSLLIKAAASGENAKSAMA
jgi:hypothetical protein